MSTFYVLLEKEDSYQVASDVCYTVFNGGEINLRLPAVLIDNPDNVSGCQSTNSVTVYARLQSSDDIIALCMLTDALKREHPIANYSLAMFYTPYARQDRVCNEGEALSIKVFANIINSLNFAEVQLLDTHSDVAGAVIKNVTTIHNQAYAIALHEGLSSKLYHEEVVLISPDAGAMKKTEAVSKAFGGVPMVQGYKRRDLLTGELSGFGVNDPDNMLEGANCLIVDDIGDGCGTFIGLAKELKKAGAASIELYVTHGIFSKGIDYVLDNGIDRVYTTNSFLSGEQHERLEYIKP
jgi:ribose-phosphate pyrophosphokinase